MGATVKALVDSTRSLYVDYGWCSAGLIQRRLRVGRHVAAALQAMLTEDIESARGGGVA